MPDEFSIIKVFGDTAQEHSNFQDNFYTLPLFSFKGERREDAQKEVFALVDIKAQSNTIEGK